MSKIGTNYSGSAHATLPFMGCGLLIHSEAVGLETKRDTLSEFDTIETPDSSRRLLYVMQPKSCLWTVKYSEAGGKRLRNSNGGILHFIYALNPEICGWGEVKSKWFTIQTNKVDIGGSGRFITSAWKEETEKMPRRPMASFVGREAKPSRRLGLGGSPPWRLAR